MDQKDIYGIDSTEDVEEIRAYASNELVEYGKVAPCLTLYRFSLKMMTIYFPREAPAEGRNHQLLQACFAANLLNASAARFIVDSSAMKSSFMKDITPDSDGYIDTLVVCYFSAVGIKCFTYPYLMHPENKYPIWEDTEKIDYKKDFLSTQEELLSFGASSFLMGKNTLPWDSYLKYLTQVGFVFSYHLPYEENTIGASLNLMMA
jgi:hypothetical protein